MSSYQMSLVLVQVQISSESSNRCSEQGGEIELRDTVSHSSLALGELPFQVVFVIRALSTYTSEISLPGWKEGIHNSSKRRGDQREYSHVKLHSLFVCLFLAKVEIY